MQLGALIGRNERVGITKQLGAHFVSVARQLLKRGQLVAWQGIKLKTSTRTSSVMKDSEAAAVLLACAELETSETAVPEDDCTPRAGCERNVTNAGAGDAKRGSATVGAFWGAPAPGRAVAAAACGAETVAAAGEVR